METLEMIPEFIKTRRQQTFSECRRLVSRINSDVQDESEELIPLEEISAQSPEDTSLTHNTCDCCQRTDIPSEKTIRIESGQLMCLTCLRAFYEASQKALILSR